MYQCSVDIYRGELDEKLVPPQSYRKQKKNYSIWEFEKIVSAVLRSAILTNLVKKWMHFDGKEAELRKI